ncbi:MAG: FecR domain-containing protein [Balneolales bacterium]
MMQTFQRIWNNQSKRTHPWDAEKAWQRLSREMDKDTKIKKGLPSLKGGSRRSHRPFLNVFMRVAATLLVAGFITVYFFQADEEANAPETEVMEEVVTDRGQRATVQLDDGSRIRLGVDSQLSYPKAFETEERTVHLTGEAYFEIVHDNRPFLVLTDDAEIQILGTEFNVQAYNQERVQVVVADGKVGVRSRISGEVDDAVLERGDMAQLYREGNGEFEISHDVDLKRHLGWLDHRLEFNDVPLEEVARKLERWYRIDIQVSDPDYNDLRFTATFDDEPITEVLSAIKYSLQLEHEFQGRLVTLYRD